MGLMVAAAEAQQQGLTINWEQLPTYNTVMSVAAGAGLILVVMLGRELARDPENVTVEGYSLAFGVLGLILTTTGFHMTVTWPLAPDFPYDNIIFGESSFAFGVLLLAAAFAGWRRGAELIASERPVERLAVVARPMSVFVVGIGLSMIAIAVAGMQFQLFVAPPPEPITGWFAQWPWVEATFVSGLYFLVGLGAVLSPLALGRRGAWFTAVGWMWAVTGVAFLLFGAFTFYAHIGLIVRTMPMPAS